MKDFKILFSNVMDSLFSDTYKEKTLENYKNRYFEELPKESGIYVIKNSDNKPIEILENPDKDNIHKKYESNFQEKCKNINKLYLYIGKTNAKRGIQNRLSNYIKYGYGKNVPHKGGYHLWFVKNNKYLFANYATIEEINEKQNKLYVNARDIAKTYHKNIAEIIEMGLICLHDLAYGYAPLANAQGQSEYKSYKNDSISTGSDIYKEWKIFWENL